MSGITLDLLKAHIMHGKNIPKILFQSVSASSVGQYGIFHPGIWY